MSSFHWMRLIEWTPSQLAVGPSETFFCPRRLSLDKEGNLITTYITKYTKYTPYTVI